ncbi:lysine-rich arabinogalactan protein 19-like [Mustela erminea]|uniref:lysine-rich arabinogalactan protein 19-like n=1 Tax=Mustela erminea TaxID=36723 RepID=UPI00138746F7|nr:lysine-rich arabinogalactan protein 19-like [Mustela erminea]
MHSDPAVPSERDHGLRPRILVRKGRRGSMGSGGGHVAERERGGPWAQECAPCHLWPGAELASLRSSICCLCPYPSRECCVTPSAVPGSEVPTTLPARPSQKPPVLCPAPEHPSSGQRRHPPAPAALACAPTPSPTRSPTRRSDALARWCPRQCSAADRVEERHRHLLSQEGHLGVQSCSVSPGPPGVSASLLPTAFPAARPQTLTPGPALQESASSAVLDGSGGMGAAPCLGENASSSQRMTFDADFLKMSFIWSHAELSSLAQTA